MVDTIAAPAVREVESGADYGKFEIEPLEPGFGTTLGNSLRRVLLSSLNGAAITSVSIDGVAHEFSAIPNVKEDVTEILLNIKEINVVSHSDEPVRITLDVRGPRRSPPVTSRPPATSRSATPTCTSAPWTGPSRTCAWTSPSSAARATSPPSATSTRASPSA